METYYSGHTEEIIGYPNDAAASAKKVEHLKFNISQHTLSLAFTSAP